MTLYLAGASALEYWRICPPVRVRRVRAALPFGTRDAGDAGFRVADLAALAEAGLGWLSSPVHLLVPCAISRRRCPRVAFHVCSRALPEGSFVRVSRDIMVSSPEFACTQAASSRSFPLFVELLYELCGRDEPVKRRRCRLPRASRLSLRSRTRLKGCAGRPP